MNVRAPPVPMVQAATPQRPSPFDGVFAVRVWVDAIAVVGACYVAVKLWDSPGDGYTSAAEILCGATTVFVQFAGGAPYNLYAARVRSASVLFALVWLLRFVAGQSWYNDGAPIPESGIVAWLVGIASWGLACASLWKALPLHPMRSPDARKLEGKAHAWAVIPALLVLWFASASPPHVSAGMMSAPPVQPAQPALVAAASSPGATVPTARGGGDVRFAVPTPESGRRVLWARGRAPVCQDAVLRRRAVLGRHGVDVDRADWVRGARRHAHARGRALRGVDFRSWRVRPRSARPRRADPAHPGSAWTSCSGAAA